MLLLSSKIVHNFGPQFQRYMIRNRKNLPAFSLPELLVVLVIMEADEKGFKARATAVVDFDRDGTYDIWEIDQDKNLRQIVKD